MKLLDRLLFWWSLDRSHRGMNDRGEGWRVLSYNPINDRAKIRHSQFGYVSGYSVQNKLWIERTSSTWKPV